NYTKPWAPGILLRRKALPAPFGHPHDDSSHRCQSWAVGGQQAAARWTVMSTGFHRPGKPAICKEGQELQLIIERGSRIIRIFSHLRAKVPKRKPGQTLDDRFWPGGPQSERRRGHGAWPARGRSRSFRSKSYDNRNRKNR